MAAPTRSSSDAVSARVDSQCLQNSTIVPGGLGDEMMQGLVGGADPVGLDARGHRFDALALPRQHQAGAIGAKRRCTIGVTERRGKTLDIGCEP